MTPPNVLAEVSRLDARDNVALTCGTESFVVYEDLGLLFVDRLLQEREWFQRRRNVEEEEEAADWIHEMASMTGETDRRSGQPGALPSRQLSVCGTFLEIAPISYLVSASLRSVMLHPMLQAAGMPTRKNGRTVSVPAPLARQARGDYCVLGQFKEGILVDFDDARL
ncbi:hypothetical protein BDZ89DRAFT_1040092 [Hymenopellis radicata]|nr:hypothetical protein BDZ89DRAFT_1040092 [Hymenopellis radicata]